MNLSALILTNNEEELIEGCLKQLTFTDEIIVLDQHSKDKTVAIAKKYTDKILQTNHQEFDKNRNLLAKEAKGKWLLYVDSDERFNQDLVNEIKSSINNNKISAYYFSRKNYILGKWLKHGGWWPDYVPRLFQKSKLIKWKGNVHESPQIDGDIAYSNKPIEHYTGNSISKMLEKTIKWAKIEATLAYKSNHPKVNSLRIIKAFTFQFINRYFIKMGLLDGTVGLIESIFQALHQSIYLTYLWELQNQSQTKCQKEKNV